MMADTNTDEKARQQRAKFSRTRVGGKPIPVALKFQTGPLADLEQIGFTFRLQLSKDAQLRREKWLGMTAQERTARVDEQILDEVCDLMIDEPTGLEDFPAPPDGEGTGKGSVGQRMRAYYTETTDEDAKFLLRQILEAADNSYWAAVTPREFRSAV
jgi:hypothetical protein